jgi:hypothetical protein
MSPAPTRSAGKALLRYVWNGKRIVAVDEEMLLRGVDDAGKTTHNSWQVI